MSSFGRRLWRHPAPRGSFCRVGASTAIGPSPAAATPGGVAAMSIPNRRQPRGWRGLSRIGDPSQRQSVTAGIILEPRYTPSRPYFRSRSRAFIARRSDAIPRRRIMASTVYRPCLSAFLFPFGAPGDLPPCIRHGPFGIAGDWHGLPLRVRAPHRGLRCMGNLSRILLFL
jgi:hypothetical protein